MACFNKAGEMKQTPSQTVGPFFYDALIADGRQISPVMAAAGARGQRMIFTGCVKDGDGAPVPDAMIEVWQADAAGIYAHPADPRHADADPALSGFGRSDTRAGGHFKFETIKPGSVQDQAPHLTVRVFSRGMLLHANTRVYFDDEPSNTRDPVLSLVPAMRRETLIAKRLPTAAILTYVLDIVLQGGGETVFFTP